MRHPVHLDRRYSIRSCLVGTLIVWLVIFSCSRVDKRQDSGEQRRGESEHAKIAVRDESSKPGRRDTGEQDPAESGNAKTLAPGSIAGPSQSAVEHIEPQPREETDLNPQKSDIDRLSALTVDLSDTIQHTQRVNSIGWVLERTYTLSDKRTIVIEYSWESIGVCKKAVATMDGETIAVATLQNYFDEENFTMDEKWGMRIYNKNFIEVEEVQYFKGELVYKASLRFSSPWPEKIAEWPVQGSKMYDVIVDWGEKTR